MRADRLIYFLFVQIIKIESPIENGWTPIKLCFDTEKEAKEYILGFGNQIKIIRPHTLNQDIYDMAKAVIDFYDQENQM